MAVTIKSSGPRGAKTYEVRVDGNLYDYTDTLFAARKLAARARAEQRGRGARRNPTKAQRRERTRKASVQRRVAVALAKFLKQANPAMKTAGAKVQKLKGGVLKITPIRANAGRRDVVTGLARKEHWYEVLHYGQPIAEIFHTKQAAGSKARQLNRKDARSARVVHVRPR
jgi:hypothetical protein